MIVSGFFTSPCDQPRMVTGEAAKTEREEGDVLDSIAAELGDLLGGLGDMAPAAEPSDGDGEELIGSSEGEE